MKQLLLGAAMLCAVAANAQDLSGYISYNRLIDLKGTDYVVASVANWGKMMVKAKYLLFINTKTGESRTVDFPKGFFMHGVEQVRVEPLGINVVVVSANTIDLDGKNGISWNDPRQVIVFSVDGKQKTQVTDDHYFSSSWVVNSETGRMVITGHYDTNNNGKDDKGDESQVLIYDLKSMSLVSKF